MGIRGEISHLLPGDPGWPGPGKTLVYSVPASDVERAIHEAVAPPCAPPSPGSRTLAELHAAAPRGPSKQRSSP